jgi:hypothetical protein
MERRVIVGRRSAVPAAALLALAGAAGCGAPRALRAADPGQALDGAPNEAQAELDRVVVRVALGRWRGQPRDLEQRLTPVDVIVRNESGRTIRLGPEAFGLVEGGKRLPPMRETEVSRAMAELHGLRSARSPPPRSGAVGGPTFPGYDDPQPYGPGSGSPAGSPVPPPESWYGSQKISATLPSGKATGLLLFFDAPARTLQDVVFEIELDDTEGASLGTIRIPFERE